MEKAAFEGWLESVSASFLTLSDQQRNQSLDQLISLSGAVQLRHLSNGLEALLKRDFLRLLPLELTFYLLHWLDPQTLLTCCLVCKQWNKVISACTEVWQGVCRDLGWRIDDSIQDASHWKGIYLKAKLRMMQLKDQEAFETSSLIGHSARVYALYYKDGLLCTVFSVDYKDDLDTLVSGSADFSVKVWSLSAGACLNTLTGHTEWVTKVILQKSEVESMVHCPGDYILLSADKYEIKIWPIGREINCKCLKTLSVSEDRSVCLQPRLQFDGRYVVCSSDLGVYQWDFASFDILRVIKTQDPANLSLLSFGEVFSLLFDTDFLYVMDLRTEKISGRWPLPAYRKSKRGSSFLPGVTSWLNGLDGRNDSGLVFATSMPDHSIHLVLWKENR
ncbi:F-box/WD repeat-containing protein 2-like isoform X2 [Salvelinus fontinalis]|uniref:F-box/WD repeat-containing protein 2-like isoform X2 n=1 Tax=Salvelinus fontinalis TaxID=8038 RepID=UPI0024869536|nr:F-box/WD repeat-containing protein 2-like isoform X2 [Salvelinus fontinalis]